MGIQHTIAFALARLSQLAGDGIQANIERQLGRSVAFLVAWSFWVSNWAAQAAVAIAGASALLWISPVFARPGFVIPTAIVSVAFFTVVNAFGVRASGVASIVTVLIRLLPAAVSPEFLGKTGKNYPLFELALLKNGRPSVGRARRLGRNAP